MNHPPYHLRHNKAVDRFLFIELLSQLDSQMAYNLSDYTYFSLGGPLLNDFQVLHQSFPNMRMVCIEGNEETHKRQKFNKPHKNIKFHVGDLSDFFANNELTGKDIVWLDFTKTTISEFELFQYVLGKIELYGIVKITLRARTILSGNLKDETKENKIRQFEEDFDDILPADYNPDRDFRGGPYRKLLLKILRVSAQKVLIDPDEKSFQPLLTCFYQDGEPMLTMTGIVLPSVEHRNLKQRMRSWKYLNLEWTEPKIINVPTLSIRERLAFDKYLPIKGNSVMRLKQQIPFELGEDETETVEQLQQYADFYRFYPFFTRVVV